MSAVLLAAVSTSPVKALDFSALLSPDLAGYEWLGGRADAFAGTSAAGSALFNYGGFTLAPGGLDRDGPRLRLYGGAGQYSYTGGVETKSGLGADIRRRADVVQAEVLAGWQFGMGAMTAKLFAGLAYEDQQMAPPDPGNDLAGAHLGAKLAVESWFDLASWLWFSADASYATVHESYSGALKLGLKPLVSLSIGPEAAASGNREFDSHRLGGFARWHCGGCDVTLSGGISGDYDDETGGYGALSVYTRF
ncbi:MAG: cellulose biosynthesis protein BcsS [Dichotomicrobium sp.]